MRAPMPRGLRIRRKSSSILLADGAVPGSDGSWPAAPAVDRVAQPLSALRRRRPMRKAYFSASWTEGVATGNDESLRAEFDGCGTCHAFGVGCDMAVDPR